MVKSNSKSRKSVKGTAHALTTGAQSPRYKELQKKYNLVTKDDVRSLEPRTFDEIREKIQLLHEFAIANKEMVDLVSATGFQVVNVLNQSVELSAKVLVLEKELKEQGINPLLSPEYVAAKKLELEMLKFIQVQKLNAVDVFSKVNARKAKRAEDSDVLFVNEEITDPVGDIE